MKKSVARPIKFEKPQMGFLSVKASAAGKPMVLRFSNALKMLREDGTPQKALDEFIADKRESGSHCPRHGDLVDPIIALVQAPQGPRVAFVCPECSDPEVLSAWRAETPGDAS